MVEVSYDSEVDAAYIYLAELKQGEVSKTYACNPKEVDGEINLDFDKDGKLVGIEILDASSKIRPEVLSESS